VPSSKRTHVIQCLTELLTVYQRVGPVLPPEQNTLRALILLSGRSSRSRCDWRALLRHKTIALEHLDRLPKIKRNLAHRVLALRDLLTPMLTALAEVPCFCGFHRTDIPDLTILRQWPSTPGRQAIAALAWHHKKKPSTMRAELARASRFARSEASRNRPAT